MGIFNNKKKNTSPDVKTPEQLAMEHAMLSDMALATISDGVIIVNGNNQIELLNPAAATMLGYDANGVIGIDIAVIFKLETSQGLPVEEASSEFLHTLRIAQPLSSREFVLINGQNQKRPIAFSVTPVADRRDQKIVTFRDISKELEEEGSQAEFISTASHEMRTPVASIEGYLGLALNPSCATIDDRARKYLEEAHASSKHLGRLFQDLLDVTKLDDKKLRIHPVPLEICGAVRKIVDGQVPSFQEKNLHYTFGSNSNMGDSAGGRMVDQEVYASVDVDFLQEIIDNLIENAIKYNSDGGGIWVNVRGDGDRVLINVTDTGIGISPDDLKHIFQKFYRADNSQTRTIGGTGLGLYLVRERVEAMGGRVWAESSFGEGSTFYVSFPRLTYEEYERRRSLMEMSMEITPQAPAEEAPKTLIEQAQATTEATPTQTAVPEDIESRPYEYPPRPFSPIKKDEPKPAPAPTPPPKPTTAPTPTTPTPPPITSPSTVHTAVVTPPPVSAEAALASAIVSPGTPPATT